MATKYKLLPCPHCGARRGLIYYDDDGEYQACIACTKCGLCGPWACGGSGFRKAAAEKWNNLPRKQGCKG